MPNTLGKNLNLCLSLLKRPQHPHPLNTNYNSLYEDFDSVPPPITTTSYVSASPSSVSTDYMETEDYNISTTTNNNNNTAAVGPSTPDLTAAYASRRFFISSPGRSNSIVDSLSLSSSNLFSSPVGEEAEAEAEDSSASSPTARVAGGVPVQTYSPDPYVDFRRSMQEMVESRDLGNLEIKEVWEYLQELLLSYLSLNPKNTHKYIVGAFTDLVVNLMSTPTNHTINHPSSSSSSSSFSSNGGIRYVLS
ncbi:transcription repressor OFP12-like [Chenopodium quinoa]|uniref:transcription repressor OFP12-like n=1 Tax=Chenopodium quinoa TaxID=63459 RepID=UPI000B783864|nr:transcription repressor OFP12-like [Chenopodium quinoa]